jgi:hypothetical protein
VWLIRLPASGFRPAVDGGKLTAVLASPRIFSDAGDKWKSSFSIPHLPVMPELDQHEIEASPTEHAMAEAPGVTLSRRNLPRASHACQRCRLKKAKCDQRQPCGNCTKHVQECTYGLRRRNTREKSIHNTRSVQAGLSSPLPSPWSGQDEPSQRGGLERTPLSDHLCMYFLDPLGSRLLPYVLHF